MRAIPLYLWVGFNLLLAFGILVTILVLHRDPPAISILLDEATRRALAPEVRGLISSIAVVANAVVFAYCALVLVLLRAGTRFGAVAASLLVVQLSGFFSDHFLGDRNLGLNLISSALLGLGLALWR
jgi:hypothetical protein